MTLQTDPQPLVPPTAYHESRSQCHWVTRIDFDGRETGLEVWQWQPQARKWCRPNQYACGMDDLLVGYKWVAVCPTPPFADEVEAVKAIIAECDAEINDDDESFLISKKDYRTLRRMLYEQVLRG